MLYAVAMGQIKIANDNSTCNSIAVDVQTALFTMHASDERMSNARKLYLDQLLLVISEVTCKFYHVHGERCPIGI